MDENDVKIKTESNLKNYTQLIEVSILEITLKKQVDIYLRTLIAEAIKNIIRTKYTEIESLVIDEIFKKETRILIENLIKEKLNEEINIHIRDMFGREGGNEQ